MGRTLLPEWLAGPIGVDVQRIRLLGVNGRAADGHLIPTMVDIQRARLLSREDFRGVARRLCRSLERKYRGAENPVS